MRRFAHLFFVVLALASVNMAQNKRIGTFRFSKSHDGHKAMVVFQTKAYVAAKHSLVRPNTSEHVKIDGRNAYGAEGTPTVEIVSAVLFFDGKQVKIPKRFYKDCFDPNFDSKYNQVGYSRNKQGLVVVMVGADGGGGYRVTWVFSKTGKHSRQIKEV